MRGSAISALMRAGIALPNFFLRFFMGLFRVHHGPHTLLMIQTIKQMTNRVPSKPYPNMVSPSSIQPLLFKGSSTVGLSQNKVCPVTDTLRPFLELFVAEYYRWSIGLTVVLQDLSSFRFLGCSCATGRVRVRSSRRIQFPNGIQT